MDKLTTLLTGTVLLQDISLAEYPFVFHGTTTRVSGFSEGEYQGLNLGLNTGDSEEKVLANRQLLYRGLEVTPDRCVYAGQIHSDRISVVDEHSLSSISSAGSCFVPQTDALITQITGIVLIILTADCIPVFIFDPVTLAIGLIHAGWRGTWKNITGKTVQSMQVQFGTNPKDCRAWISVGICSSCYTVSPELTDQFRIRYEKVPQLPDKLDLAAVNKYQLQQSGIPIPSIQTSSHCSCHSPEMFYSYRHSGKKSGRIASLIMLR